MNKNVRNTNLVFETNGKSYSTTLNRTISEVPTTGLRWLVKKDGTKILQQAFEIYDQDNYRIEWKDIREVEDEV